MTEPILLTVKECSKLLNLSENRLRELLRRGVIPHVHFDRQVRVPKAALEEFIAKETAHRHPESDAVRIVREAREAAARFLAPRSRVGQANGLSKAGRR